MRIVRYNLEIDESNRHGNDCALKWPSARGSFVKADWLRSIRGNRVHGMID